MGLFSRNKDQLSRKIKKKLDEFAEIGNQLEDKEQYDKAIQAWQEGLDLIPEPKQMYSETIWFLASIGDVYFSQHKYVEAYECFDKARGNLSGEGYANPFIMLRLGESCLEIGDEKNAIEYLLRAYMLEGKDIFEEDLKYFEFLKTHVDHIE